MKNRNAGRRVTGFIAAICLFVPGLGEADSLFSKAVADKGTFIAETTQRFEAGDLITVLVRENTQSSTDSNTNTKKESDVDSSAGEAANPFLIEGLGLNPDFLPNWLIEAENEQKSRGDTARNNQVTMTITCVVEEVLPNGNVLLAGSKSVKVNREESRMHISGQVRARDVQPDNTVDSGLVADAKVELVGDGPLWRNEKRGFITRFLDWFNPN